MTDFGIARLPSQSSHFSRRYVIQFLLGSGAMGSVHRAYDRLSARQVALKRVLTEFDTLGQNSGSESADLRFSLAQEFEVLASLRHPNIIGVLDYGFDNERLPYFTMELLQNAQPLTDAAIGKPLNQQIDLLVQLLRALLYLHQRRILHRDLKPNNILVENQIVKVVDFGLSTNIAMNSDSSGNVVGTLAYMAPEILQGATASPASDLYSTGVIAYQLFAGKHPFETSYRIDLLLDQIINRAPDFSALPVEEPIRLIIERLLAKVPQDRFQNAKEVLYALRSATGTLLHIETESTRESFLQASQFIGRERELELLLSALDSATKGSGQSVLIGGESGIGKSRLFHEVKTRAEVQGTLVITGQAITESTAPYHLWRECFRWLAILIDITDDEAGLLRSVVPDLATLIERDIPEFALSEPQTFQQRLHDLIVSLFRRHGQPMVILFEDLQWAKEEDLALLVHLTKSAESLPMLVLGNYRDDELPMLPSRLPSMRALKIQRLNEAEIAALSEMMLGQAQPSVVDLLVNQTEGNIYFLVEIVRALAEEAGQLENVGNQTLPPRIFTAGIQQIVERRLNQISLADRNLLGLTAVLGRQLDLPALRTRVSAPELDRWLQDCAAVAVLEVNDNRWRFVHDKLREGVLSNLDQLQSRELHRQAATALETAYPNDDRLAAQLAFHWKMAGDATAEAHYALLAARLAQGVFATHEANTLYTQALEALEKLPDTLENRRSRVDAIILRAQITLTLVQPNKYLEQLATAEQLVYSISPSRNVSDMEATDQGRVSKIHLQVGHAHFGISNLPEAIKHYTEALRIGQNLGDEGLIAPSAAVLGRIYAVQGRYVEAEKLLGSAAQLLQKLNLVPQWSRTMQIFGFAHAGRGYYHQGIEILANVREQARQINDFSAVVFTHTSASGIHITVSGDLDSATYEAEQGIEVARTVRDLTSLYIPYGYAAWAESRRGNHQLAMDYCASATSIANRFGGLLLWTESFYYVEAEVTFNAGKREEAITLCQKALDYAVKVFSVINEVRIYNLLGVIYAGTQIVQSDAYFSKAIQTAEPYDLRMEEMNVRVNWGNALMKRGDAQAGRQHLEVALAQFHTSNLPIRIAEVQRLLSQAKSE